MGLRFQQLKKLWLLYLFLLFFAFFMFAISINLYVTSIQGSDTEMRYVISPLGHTISIAQLPFGA